MDPFETLGIARSFDVDLGAIEKTHRELSRTLHPDRFASAGVSERRSALAKAIEVNEAWRIVRDPIGRAETLLRLAGAETVEGAEPAARPELLMAMLELREALGDAKQARDLAAIRRMAVDVASRASDVERSLATGFARGVVPGDATALSRWVGELRFYRRFLDEVSAIEDELAA